jgi:hypothetical protein
MRKAIREAQAQLASLETQLGACAALAAGGVTALEQKRDRSVGGMDRELKVVEARLAEARATVTRESAAARSELGARGKAPAAGRVDGAVAPALATLAPVEEAAGRNRAQIAAARGEADRLVSDGRKVSTAATAPLAALGAEVAAGKAALAALERKLVQMEQALDKTLGELERDAKAGIAAVQQVLQQAIDVAKSTLQVVLETLGTFTKTLTQAMDAVEMTISEVSDKGEALVQSLLGLLDTVMGVIDKIPVDALPTMMVAPTRTLITQGVTQFAGALSAGARTASSTLATLGQKISAQVEKVSGEVGKKIDAAKTDLLAKVDQVIQQVQSKAAELMSKIDGFLTKLEEQIAAQIAAVQQQLATLAAETLGPVVTLADGGPGQIALVQQSLQTQLAAIDKQLDAATAPPAQTLAQVRTQADAAIPQTLATARRELQAVRASAG